MRFPLHAVALAAVTALAPLGAIAQSPACTHTAGMVVSLTGAAGRFGQAASKSVELAFNELNKAAGAQGIAGCKLALDLRDAQSQGLVAVDQARQLVDLKKVPATIGGVIRSVSIPYGQNIHPSQFPDQRHRFDCHRSTQRGPPQRPGLDRGRASTVAAGVPDFLTIRDIGCPSAGSETTVCSLLHNQRTTQ